MDTVPFSNNRGGFEAEIIGGYAQLKSIIGQIWEKRGNTSLHRVFRNWTYKQLSYNKTDMTHDIVWWCVKPWVQWCVKPWLYEFHDIEWALSILLFLLSGSCFQEHNHWNMCKLVTWVNNWYQIERKSNFPEIWKTHKILSTILNNVVWSINTYLKSSLVE